MGGAGGGARTRGWDAFRSGYDGARGAGVGQSERRGGGMDPGLDWGAEVWEGLVPGPAASGALVELGGG